MILTRFCIINIAVKSLKNHIRVLLYAYEKHFGRSVFDKLFSKNKRRERWRSYWSDGRMLLIILFDSRTSVIYLTWLISSQSDYLDEFSKLVMIIWLMRWGTILGKNFVAWGSWLHDLECISNLFRYYHWRFLDCSKDRLGLIDWLGNDLYEQYNVPTFSYFPPPTGASLLPYFIFGESCMWLFPDAKEFIDFLSIIESIGVEVAKVELITNRDRKIIFDETREHDRNLSQTWSNEPTENFLYKHSLDWIIWVLKYE